MSRESGAADGVKSKKRWFRRLRGVVGTGLLWGAAWSGLGGTWLAIRLGGPGWVGTTLILAALIGVAGVISGSGFAVVLSLAGQRIEFEDLTYLRVASLGALGSIAAWTPLILVMNRSPVLPLIGIIGALGAISSSGTLTVARAGYPAPALEGERPDPSISRG